MRYSKEFLYHFSCEKCYNWWSYPATTVPDFQDKIWNCPHCGHEHLPPHLNEVKHPGLDLKTIREYM